MFQAFYQRFETILSKQCVSWSDEQKVCCFKNLNVNQQCEKFNLKDLSIDMFKCLVFVQGLTASHDKNICLRILNKMEQGPNITLQKIMEECQCMLNIKHDNFAMEEKYISCVHGVQPKLKSAKDDVKPSLCFGCSRLH